MTLNRFARGMGYVCSGFVVGAMLAGAAQHIQAATTSHHAIHHATHAPLVLASQFTPADAGGRMACNGHYLRWYGPDANVVAMRSHALCGRRVRICWRHRCAVARVEDWGPAAWTGRIVDLGPGVVRALGFGPWGFGVRTVSLEVTR
jgi:hypothetical protein